MGSKDFRPYRSASEHVTEFSSAGEPHTWRDCGARQQGLAVLCPDTSSTASGRQRTETKGDNEQKPKGTDPPTKLLSLPHRDWHPACDQVGGTGRGAPGRADFKTARKPGNQPWFRLRDSSCPRRPECHRNRKINLGILRPGLVWARLCKTRPQNLKPDPARPEPHE